MAGEVPRVGEVADSAFFGAEGGDGPEALDPAVVALIDDLISRSIPGREGLLSVLLGVQHTFDRVSWRVQELVADRYGMSAAQVAGVVGFYPELSPERRASERSPGGACEPAPPVRRAYDVLSRCGVVDPEDIEHAVRLGAYKALRRALVDCEPATLIDRVKRSGLQERGGSGFPVGLKWALVAGTEADHRFVVGNGDGLGAEPTVDQVLLEADPHRVIEGMVLAGYAVGAGQGRLFLRSEYRAGIERMERALAQARRAGFLGHRVAGSGVDFDIEICHSAGASIGGEETSLINLIQGRRATARPRPPFPAVSGLWDRPTLINRLETLANIPAIVARDGDATTPAPGTSKVIGVSGPGIEPFLAEVPLGTTVAELVDAFLDGEVVRRIRAVHVGGPGGASFGPDRFDTALDYGAMRGLGANLGTAGVVVLDESVCPVAHTRSLVAASAAESCGSCPPCRIGTRVVLDLLDGVEAGRAAVSDLDRLDRLCRHIAETSLCELGRNATVPVLTGLRFLRREYERHGVDGGCPGTG